MKKILSIILSAATLSASITIFAACGQKPSDTAADTTSDKPVVTTAAPSETTPNSNNSVTSAPASTTDAPTGVQTAPPTSQQSAGEDALSLILVDSSHPFDKAGIADRVTSLYDNPDRGKTYKVSGSDIYLLDTAAGAFLEMMGDRGRNDDVYGDDSYLILAASTYQKNSAAAPTSTKDTGLYFKVQSYTANGQSRPLTENSAMYDNIKYYAALYGFIWVSDDGSGTTFRYVGAEHALYIKVNNLTLSQYINLLKTKHNTLDNALIINDTRTFYAASVTKEYIASLQKEGRAVSFSSTNEGGYVVTIRENYIVSFESYASIIDMYKIIVGVSSFSDFYGTPYFPDHILTDDATTITLYYAKYWQGANTSNAGYAIMDINGDGIDELILLHTSIYNDYYHIVAVFTDFGSPTMVACAARWEFIDILSGGTIIDNSVGWANWTQGGVDYCDIMRINDGKIEYIVSFGSEEIDNDQCSYYKISENGEKASISKDEFDELVSEWFFAESYTQFVKIPGFVFVPLY